MNDRVILHSDANCFYASVEMLLNPELQGNQHYRAADVMNTEQVVNFTIRYRRDVKPGMWVKFQDEKWIISTLGEYSFKKNVSRPKGIHREGGKRMSRATPECASAAQQDAHETFAQAKRRARGGEGG